MMLHRELPFLITAHPVGVAVRGEARETRVSGIGKTNRGRHTTGCVAARFFGAWRCPAEEGLKHVATVSTDLAATSGGSRAARGATVSPVEALLTVREAAARASVCEETIRRAYLCGALRIQRIGTRTIRVRPKELDAWLAAGARTRRG